MVATFFAWLIPILMMPTGIGLKVIAALGDSFSADRESWTDRWLWAGAGLFALGLGLTAINIWELF